ncbi:MAG: alpha/beta hydrolase [Faecalibacterium sp.]|nr:alpha/beta hydrolase [Ruminococcus sp.]MCM1392771.1 alpha/beta hydrolase [Ruminococcus sp.]MCM1485323.1 alpha/beta hydrolase [Faecalibacterium sp.]
MLKKFSITQEMINPELRFIGSAIRSVWESFSEKKFKFCNFALDHVGSILFKVKNAELKEVYLNRNDGSKLRMCLYLPKNRKSNVPGVLWLHGGGYALGIPEQDSGYIDDLIAVSGCVVLAPDYMNATKAPYPAALNDCYMALEWLKNHAGELGIRDDQLFVGGDSAGGGLTAAVTLLARDRGEISVAFQMPIYPMLDDRMITQSSQNNDAPIWNSKSNEAAWKLYLGDLCGTDNVPKYAAPARETDYSNLPPTLTYVGTIDPFHDETLFYIENLKAAGVETKLKTYDGCFHGFDLFKFTSMYKDSRDFLLEGFKYAVNNCYSPQPETIS